MLVLEPAGGRTVAGAETGGGRLGGGGSSEGRIQAALRELLACGVGTKKAASIIASLTGLPRRQVYHLALAPRRRGCRGAQGRLLE